MAHLLVETFVEIISVLVLQLADFLLVLMRESEGVSYVAIVMMTNRRVLAATHHSAVLPAFVTLPRPA